MSLTGWRDSDRSADLWFWNSLGRTSPMKTEWRPRCDIYEEGEYVHVEFELPGVCIDDIGLTANEQGRLILSTKKNMEEPELKGTFYLNERNFGNFYRSLDLPDYVDTEKLDAIFTNGVLKITMKVKEAVEESVHRQFIPIHPHST